MFTGIIEELGIIKDFQPNFSGMDLIVSCEKILEDIHLGDSISVNGCCQTVVEFGKDWFKTNLSGETLKITTFSDIKKGDKVNLERAMSVNSRFGGHIVQGHIDGTSTIKEIKNDGDFFIITFNLESEISKYIVNKGAITVEGISLTVSNIDKNTFSVAIIPHTFKNTTLQFKKIGDRINIETDILGRYVEKMLNQKNASCKIDESFLKENGFM